VKRAGRPGVLPMRGSATGGVGRGAEMPAALPCPPAFGLSAASALPDCRPLPLHLPVPMCSIFVSDLLANLRPVYGP